MGVTVSFFVFFSKLALSLSHSAQWTYLDNRGYEPHEVMNYLNIYTSEHRS